GAIHVWELDTSVTRPHLVLDEAEVLFLSEPALSPVGDRLAYAQASGPMKLDVRIVDLDWGRRVDHLRAEREPLDVGTEHCALRFSPDGTKLALTVESGLVRVWDVGEGALPEPRRIDVPRQRSAYVYFSDDGDGALVTDWGRTQDVTQLRGLDGPRSEIQVEHLPMARGGVRARVLALDRSRGYVAGGSSRRQVYLWERASGELLWTLDAAGAGTWNVGFLGDTRWLAAQSFEGIRLWHLHSPEWQRPAIETPRGPGALAVGDASILTTFGPAQLLLVDRRTGARRALPCPMPTEQVRDLLLQRSGQDLLVAGEGGLWLVDREGEARRLEGHAGAVNGVASTGGVVHSVGEDGRVLSWNIVPGQVPPPTEVLRHGRPLRALATGADALSVADDQGTVRRSLMGDAPTTESPASETCLAWNPAGTLLAFGSSARRKVCLWPAGSQTRAVALPAAPTVLAFDPQHPYLAAGLASGEVVLLRHDLVDPLPCVVWSGQAPLDLAYAPGGEVLVIRSGDGVVHRIAASAEVLAADLAQRLPDE
ncbi:MAG: WD40 repeat domain-containing protein, partial [Planctomycetota bacterium]|nr:WD40 repeat domain-containing protein [Planctomycetota bacterium]